MLVRLALALLLTAAPASATGQTRVLDLAGVPFNPVLAVDARDPATVLIFITTDCPISDRYAPDIQRLARRYSSFGIRFFLVYPVGTDTPVVVREHLKKFGYQLSAVRDTAQELVKLTGVSVTPEAAVVDSHGRVLYRGRIDDRYIELGKDRVEPTVHDLDRALGAISVRRPAPVRETKAVGCFIADLVK